MGGACSRYGGEQRHIQGFGKEKPEGKRPLVRPRRTWVYNVKLDVQELGYGSMDWIELVQDRDRWGALMNTVMKHRVP